MKRAPLRWFVAVAFGASLGLLVSATAHVDAEADESAQDSVEEALRGFLSALAKGEIEGAYALVAPTTKEKGDAIAGVKVDYDSFAKEAKAQPPEKFGTYKLGKRRQEKEDRVRIFLHFKDGDTDETLLVREGKRWYVADPIHIIR
jgi:hypothetical protein